MKKFVLFLSLLICITANAQNYYDSSMVEKKKPEKETFWDKTFVGGSCGFMFGNKTIVNLSPIVGYKITDKVHAGVGITYEYYRYSDPNYYLETNIYGGSVFSRYYFRPTVFGHAELEYLNLEAFDYDDRRVDVESMLVGAGFIQHFGRNSGIVAMALYNLTESAYTPYGSPIIIRLGVNIGL